jgi:hypothetical protein
MEPEPYSDPPPCPAIYHKVVPGYLSRPRCGYSVDHREASVKDQHWDPRGFRWPRESTP